MFRVCFSNAFDKDVLLTRDQLRGPVRWNAVLTPGISASLFFVNCLSTAGNDHHVEARLEFGGRAADVTLRCTPYQAY